MILIDDWLLSREECMRQEVIGDGLVDGKELRGKSAAAKRIKWRGRPNWQGDAGIVGCGEMRGISPANSHNFGLGELKPCCSIRIGRLSELDLIAVFC